MKKILSLIAVVLFLNNSFANVGITAPNMAITVAGCTFPSSYNALGNIVIDEGANADFDFPAASTNYTIVLTAPANFEFQSGTGTIANTGSGDITALSMVVTATTITITYQSSDANRTNEDDIITISGIQVRAITAASSGNATRTGGTGTVAGLVSGNSVASFSSACPMTVTAATVSQSSVATISNCGLNEQIVRLEITASGTLSPLTLTQIQSNFSGTAVSANASLAKIYYTGTSATFSTTTLFGSATPSATTYNINGSQSLAAGVNYFWLVYNLNNTGTPGNTVDGVITQFTASAVNYTGSSSPAISVTDPAGSRAIVICQAPGGVAGSSLWLKSNASTSTTTDGAPVASWSSQSSPPVTVSQGTASFQPTYKEGSGTGANNRFNYNPFIYTDGSTNRLVQTGNIDLGNTSAGMSAYQVIGQDNGIVSMDWYHTSNGNIKLKGDGVLYINRYNGLSEANMKFTPTTFQACVNNIRGACGAISSGRSNGIDMAPTSNGWRIAVQNGISIGATLDNTEFMQGGMGEFIIFPFVLNATDNLKVESYLAIKHGITLGNPSNVSNYLSASGAIIWTGNSAYQNNIIGIGRDDNSVLLQKQSHQYDDTVRIYKGVLASTNIANTASFSQSESFVVMGSNTGKLCSTTAALAEMPLGLTNCLLYSRLEREWLVTRTNMGETFNLDIKLSACGAPGSVTVSDLRLLVDDDGNFANGGTQCYYNGDGTGLVISYSNPTITVSGISTTHIPNNISRYITIASINEATPLPVQLTHFTATPNAQQRMVDLNWTTQTEINSDVFILEKSTDMTNWSLLSITNAAGYSYNTLNYSDIDVKPVWGTNYYRLRLVDKDGAERFSEIRSADFKSPEDISVYPNPSSGLVHIQGKRLDVQTISIFDQTGRLVQCPVQQMSNEHCTINFQGISQGVYYIELINQNEKTIYRLDLIP